MAYNAGQPRDRAADERLLSGYLDELRARYPKLRVITKSDSTLCRLIDRTLRVITFGGMRSFLTSFVTTLGHRIYVPDGWERWAPAERYCTLRHEIVHVEQFRRYTFPGMVVLYLLVPPLVGFAPGRAWLEWQGYRETLMATWQVYGPETARSASMQAHIVARFTGPEYAWMWVAGGQVRRWVTRELERLAASPPPPLP